MDVIYVNEKVHEQCTNLKAAQKLFGGDKQLAVRLLARINQIVAADVLRDIVLTQPLRFHSLQGNLDGFFAIDVKTRKEPWRIILQPLDENEEPYVPCNIDEISGIVRIIEITEVSRHYE